MMRDIQLDPLLLLDDEIIAELREVMEARLWPFRA
jgi:hypothetical protein